MNDNEKSPITLKLIEIKSRKLDGSISEQYTDVLSISQNEVRYQCNYMDPNRDDVSWSYTYDSKNSDHYWSMLFDTFPRIKGFQGKILDGSEYRMVYIDDDTDIVKVPRGKEPMYFIPRVRFAVPRFEDTPECLKASFLEPIPAFF